MSEKKPSIATRLGIIICGQAFKKTEEFVFDTLLYASVIAYCTDTYGLLWGNAAAFSILLPLTGLGCLAYIYMYDKLKIDWLGLELLKEMEETHWLVRRVARWGKVPLFIAFSLFTDAFMTIVYMRPRERAYEGFTRTEKILFLVSLVISTSYWTLRWNVIIQIALAVWAKFKYLL